MSSLWSSSYVSTSYSSELATPEPPPASPKESSPNNEATKAPPIVAIVAGITACTVIGLNVGWLVIRHRRRRSQEEEGKYKDKDGNTALTGSDRQPDRGCLSYSKPQLEDTGIVELEADLAPSGATGKPGVCYELEAIEKPTELRTSVATWLSRRTERSRRGGAGAFYCELANDDLHIKQEYPFLVGSAPIHSKIVLLLQQKIFA
ncbi:hypothetical protein PG989_007260 [Apiospora arundinis]